MQLTIERASLLRSLGHVQSVVERRNTIPILNNVLMETGDGTLKLTATDMELSISETVSADVGAQGAITAPAHTLYDIVRKLPDGAQVALESGNGDGQLVLRSGRSNFQLQALPPADFPATGDEDLPFHFVLSSGDARALIDQTRFAISTEETRYYLNGIYLHAAERDGVAMLRAVATDGHRLARFDVPLPEGAADIPGVIVPRKMVNEWRKLIDESDADISVGLSDAKLVLAFDDATLTSKLIDGTFPDYQRVVPEGNEKILEVDCRTFAEAVDRVSTISTEKSRAVKLALDAGAMTLSASSLDQGRAEEEIEVGYDAEAMEIGFNSRYLLDISERIQGEKASFRLGDSASAAIVSDVDDANALYVIMPMRV
ncbi:MAG: DNA polymerase III subunit beta [Alphaproteobacteria bacterium]|nr:DNA polymerase III subunit beta [Alphaproteobacteria bacterium]